MRVLGITEGDCGAAAVEDGRIVAAVNEERLTRMKLVEGFPRRAIWETLRLCNWPIESIDAVIVGGTKEFFNDELKPFRGWLRDEREYHGIGGHIKHLAGKLSRYRNRLPVLESAYYAALAPSYWHRRSAVTRVLRGEYGVACPIRFVDHHLAHVTSAYFTSGFDDALIVSMDGGGDGKSSLIYAARNGRLEYVHHTSAFNSLGNYYAYLTHICGFAAMRHEGKVTGLAAHGQPRYLSVLRQFIDERDGRLFNDGGVVFHEALAELRRRLPAGWTREDLAASIQAHTEELVRRYVRHWARQTGLRDVALAGGVFANVRVNEEVLNLAEVDRVFIFPHMGDGGLGVGAALAACLPGTLDRMMPRDSSPLPHVYLGTPLAVSEIEIAMRKHALAPEPLSQSIEDEIADLLAQGHVVARAHGAMEYGPRALGNRSILYQPTDRSVNDWLNTNLQRTEFMPFAPSVLPDEVDRCFGSAADGAKHAAEFMTITFHCTPWMRREMPGVVHLDGTARPQIVRREHNPGFHRIIEAFAERTGLPGIINTSFNMHEEPIVCTADDCLRAFLAGKLDYIALGPYLIRHPAGVSHQLQPVRGARVQEASPR
ncbi:MAG TPA: carbamoyltransferase C-terminal domain-containing protein [Gemmatimonadaceae bacterium]|nr:carbamoyltransferase C-terminal domain-containing protein [Gemmatimonadaceae bacterium]